MEWIRQGEGRWSRPPKTALIRSYLTENSSSANRILRPRFYRLAAIPIFSHRILPTTRAFPYSIRSSPADVKQNNRNFASYFHNRSRKKPCPFSNITVDGWRGHAAPALSMFLCLFSVYMLFRYLYMVCDQRGWVKAYKLRSQFIFAVAIWLSFASCTLSRDFLLVCEGCLSNFTSY